jgi:homocysteine S-methyltransferase
MPETLPQLAGDRLFITDGGLETVLVFQHGLELPAFAAFPLLEDEGGRALLRAYYEPFIETAARHGAGLVVDTATFRANPDWGAEIGYDRAALDAVNRAAVALAEDVRAEAGARGVHAVVSGAIGPRGDGYVPSKVMTAEEAEAYHRVQIATFAQTSADMVCAFTLNYVEEAVGIARAARAEELPAAISFTVEVDGRLPDGRSLREAIERVEAETDGSPAYYMVNCAHPTHVAPALADGGPWRERIVALRANASRMSHAELDEAELLDDGDPAELAAEYRALRERLPAVNVVGGCCGTDHRHVERICAAWPG